MQPHRRNQAHWKKWAEKYPFIALSSKALKPDVPESFGIKPYIAVPTDDGQHRLWGFETEEKRDEFVRMFKDRTAQSWGTR